AAMRAFPSGGKKKVTRWPCRRALAVLARAPPVDGDTVECRLFLGTFLSAEQQELLGELKGQNDKLVVAWGRRLRWVKHVKLHMTWLFLGKTESSAIDTIGERLSGIVTGYAPMQVTYDRLEFWPSARKPRQLVVTPS